MRVLLTSLFVVFVLFSVGCDDAPDPEPAEDDHVQESEPEETPEAEPAAARYPNEACARVIVVAWQGAVAAGDDVERSEDEARERVGVLRERVVAGAAFADVARAESDASSSGPRGGLLGTYTREDFPEIHAPIRDAVFELAVDELSEPIRAPYGWTIAERCVVEKVHTRHILIRYAGARNAGDEITRTEAEARAIAEELHGEVTTDTFEATARERSEDSSAENGGDIGSVGRGLLMPEYEEAAFSLEIDAISPVVQTAFGFHVIQRLER